jgi:hypothetical protein
MVAPRCPSPVPPLAPRPSLFCAASSPPRARLMRRCTHPYRPFLYRTAAPPPLSH